MTSSSDTSRAPTNATEKERQWETSSLLRLDMETYVESEVGHTHHPMANIILPLPRPIYIYDIPCLFFFSWPADVSLHLSKLIHGARVINKLTR